MAKLILTRGIPASGKSTWAKGFVGETAGRVRVSRDDLRRMLFGAERMWSMDRDQERQVTIIVENIVKQYLAKDFTVVLDATNLVAKNVKVWYDICEDVEFKDFPIREWVAINRDSARPKDEQVGEDVIRNFVRRFRADGKLPDPPERIRPAIHSVEPYVYDGVVTKPPAYIVDIDGTLAHVVDGGRSHYDYSRVSEDAFDYEVASVVNSLWNNGNAIILVSGREDWCRVDTENWLRERGVPFDKLLMRATDDHRPDDIVKLEIFNEHIRNDYYVRGVFDDRDRVVKMWRSLGLKCYQVAEGNF